MFIKLKVIYTDGNEDNVDASHFIQSLESGKIAAIQCAEGWLEIRRNQIVGYTPGYEGLNRRKVKPETN